jgi:DNA-binding IclR family transcriptional regulator
MSAGVHTHQVINRVMAILNALEHQPLGRSLGQLAVATGMPRSTVQRLVESLKQHRILMPAEHGTRLGPALARLAGAAHLDFLDTARPALERLSRATTEAVNVCQLREGSLVIVAHLPCSQPLGVSTPVGSCYPAQGTAVAQALASTRPTCQATDVAVDSQASIPGVGSIALAIGGGAAPAYALSLWLPRQRLDANRLALQCALIACRDEIQALTGGQAV